MHLGLRRGVSFCDVDDRLIFLDLVADRYFCLADGPEHALRRAMRGAVLPTEDLRHLDGLVERRILVRDRDADEIRTCPALAPTSFSLLEQSLPDPGKVAVASAVAATLAGIAGLKLRTLQRNLAGAATPEDARSLPEEERLRYLRLLAGAFDKAAGLLSAHDRCLARSLAVARTARRHGLSVQIVFGVALGPFTAHSWVQSGSILINDRIDTIRAYTPILVR